MYLSQFNSSLDTPAVSVARLLPRNLTSPYGETCENIHDCRTLYSIVWSCVATILACTWAAIHPNIPPQDAHWLSNLGRRVVTTVYAIIAPEVVVFWAVKQWITSRRLAEKHKGRGWTQTHGFFAIMGGFVIFQDHKVLRVVDPSKDLDKLGTKQPELRVDSSPTDSISLARKPAPTSDFAWSDSGSNNDKTSLLSRQPERVTQESQIDLPTLLDDGYQSMEDEVDISTLPFPDISPDEIKDRSKGDWTSKGLAVLQTSWFIAQCITRTVHKLPVTELELATCAFAALNTVTYVLWWDKPQSVDCPYAIGRQAFNVKATLPEKRNKSMKSRIVHVLNWVDASSDFNDNDSIFTVLLGLTLLPFAPLIGMIFGSELKKDSVCVGSYYAGDLSDGDKIISTVVVVACSTVFGAIHCIGWSFEFPSRLDQLLWRDSSLVITCLPLIEAAAILLVLLWYIDKFTAVLGDWGSIVLARVGFVVMTISPMLYIVARITLLVLAFVGLKALPPGAYQTVSWTNFIPHI